MYYGIINADWSLLCILPAVIRQWRFCYISTTATYLDRFANSAGAINAINAINVTEVKGFAIVTMNVRDNAVRNHALKISRDSLTTGMRRRPDEKASDEVRRRKTTMRRSLDLMT
jgi:hypothetical protein